MPTFFIDNREVEVPPGTTILEAARKLDIHIPTLCHLEGLAPSTSCFVCVVKIKGLAHLVPACATVAHEGMVVESETEEVHEARTTALELLLSDHLGDCLAPCHTVCPAQMNIALMNRQIAEGDLEGALVTVKNDIALPAVLGRICPAPCEKGCRRAAHDEAVSICLLKRYVADVDLARPEPYLPARAPDSGKSVAVIGAGPAGLAAAYYLLIDGHAVTAFDDAEQPGGALRTSMPDGLLPLEVLDAEVAVIRRLGARFRLGTAVGADPSLADLKRDFDAIFIACGELPKETREAWGLRSGPKGIAVDRRTYQTSDEGVFAGGNAVAPSRMTVRAVAHGKEAAAAISQYLTGRPVTGASRPFTSRFGKLRDGEVELFLPEASDAKRLEPSGAAASGFTPEEAPAEALRCLHCDCRKPDNCKLRDYSELYGAGQTRFKAERRLFVQHRQHGEVVFEPGKCISCGICITITEEAREPLGLTFIGRGFDVRVGVPFGASLDKGLTTVARRCVEDCPTGALAFLK